ncbi:hypothetical protein B0H11DRAFT_2151964 [Mycena galericulata]|nr:hypothetical protein B0H11DRAFT_2151964 [Mycena galericulata]
MNISSARAYIDNAIRRNQNRAARGPYGTFTAGPRQRWVKTSSISAAAEAKIQRALQHAWAESTVQKYSSSLEAFFRFCDKEKVAKEQRLPASEFLLCAFAASRVGEVAGVTARGAIAAVKAWHIMNDAAWNGGLRLRYTIRGVNNLAPASSKQDQRPPVTAAMLDILEAELNHDDPSDAAVFAAACCAFWGQARLGEILSNAQGSFKAGTIPTAADLKPPSTRAGSRVLRLPYTKTKGARGDDAMLCRQSCPSDPIRAVENHLSVNDIPPDMPLFSFRDKRGKLLCLTRKKLLARCNEIWTRHGFPARTGHTFRIGGTTELLLAGVNPDVVQAMGRWQSEAFKAYWRRLDLLAPLHAEYIDL